MGRQRPRLLSAAEGSYQLLKAIPGYQMGTPRGEALKEVSECLLSSS